MRRRKGKCIGSGVLSGGRECRKETKKCRKFLSEDFVCLSTPRRGSWCSSSSTNTGTHSELVNNKAELKLLLFYMPGLLCSASESVNSSSGLRGREVDGVEGAIISHFIVRTLLCRLKHKQLSRSGLIKKKEPKGIKRPPVEITIILQFIW